MNVKEPIQPGKLLVVIDRIERPGAGTEGQVLLLMDLLHQRGVQLKLLVLNSSRWLEAADFPWSVEVMRASSIKSPATWYRLWRAARRSRAEGYEIAQVFFNDASLLCPPIFALLRMRTVIARRDMGFWYTWWHRFILPMTGLFVTSAIVNSHAVGKVTQKVEKLPKNKIHVIYNGYDTSRKKSNTEVDGPDQVRALKAQGTRLLGLLANIRPIKRIEDAVLAVASLGSRYDDVHLVVIGAGDPEPINRRARALGIGGRLHCIGSRDDVAACLGYLDIALLCSESEGFSNAIVEYQHAGLPVVCSDTGGNPEAVTHGETGLLYPVGDVQVLVKSIKNLLDNPGRGKEMGHKGRAVALHRYHPDAMANSYLDIYKKFGSQGNILPEKVRGEGTQNL